MLNNPSESGGFFDADTCKRGPYIPFGKYVRNFILLWMMNKKHWSKYAELYIIIYNTADQRRYMISCGRNEEE